MKKERDELMPRRPGGMTPGLVLALAIHGLLLIAIAIGVNWRSSEPEGVEAELWAAVPQTAAPRAVEPEPKPDPKPEPEPEPPPPKPAPKPEPLPDPQIAIEKAQREEEARKQKALEEERERLEQERRKKEQEEERKKEEEERRKKEEARVLAEKRQRELDEKRRKQEEQRLAALREENLKRIMGQAGATGDPSSTGRTARSAGPSSGYAGRIKARIKPNLSFPDTVAGNPPVEVEIQLSPDGTILASRVLKSSGSIEWDNAVLRAIDKTGTLPRDENGRVWTPMIIEWRPRD